LRWHSQHFLAFRFFSWHSYVGLDYFRILLSFGVANLPESDAGESWWAAVVVVLSAAVVLAVEVVVVVTVVRVSGMIARYCLRHLFNCKISDEWSTVLIMKTLFIVSSFKHSSLFLVGVAGM
jgi:hypothetical protein